MDKHFLIYGAVLAGCLAVGAAKAAINCATPPSCEDLGYKQTVNDCEERMSLACPFDETKVFCGDAIPVTCKVGSIIYSDRQCYLGKPEGLTATAVVYDETNRLALSIDEVQLTFGAVGTDTLLDNCSASNTLCQPDGEANTESLVINGVGQSVSYAAPYCYLKSQAWGSARWFLPSMKEIKGFYTNKEAINTALARLGAISIDKVPSGMGRKIFWTSNEIGSTTAVGMRQDEGTFSTNMKHHTRSVRCVVKY